MRAANQSGAQSTRSRSPLGINEGQGSLTCLSCQTSRSTSRHSSGAFWAKPSLDIRIRSPFLLRTFDPPLKSVNGKAVQKVRRLGKRIALGFDDELWLVLHLMIAGRLHWKPVGVKLLGKSSLASFEFTQGSLQLTEAGTKHRASLSLLRGEDALRGQDPGGP